MRFKILIIAATALMLSGCETTGVPSDGSALRFICRTGGISVSALATLKPSLSVPTRAIISRVVGDIDPFCSPETQPTLTDVAQIALTVALAELARQFLAPPPTPPVSLFAAPAVAADWPTIRAAWVAARDRWSAP